MNFFNRGISNVPNVCSQTNFPLGSVKADSSSLRALTYRSPKIWDIVPPEMKNLETLLTIQDENQISEVYPLSL